MKHFAFYFSPSFTLFSSAHFQSLLRLKPGELLFFWPKIKSLFQTVEDKQQSGGRFSDQNLGGAADSSEWVRLQGAEPEQNQIRTTQNRHTSCRERNQQTEAAAACAGRPEATQRAGWSQFIGAGPPADR